MERNEKLEYEIITDAEVFDLLELFEEQFKSFISDSNYPPNLDYFVSRRDLIDMIIRVDKRDAYFHCFHDMEINERKQAALYAYWILKFRPFTIIDNRCLDKENESTVNEAFAIYIICSILFYSKKLESTTAKKETFYKKLMYAFRYRSISIDSILLLVESISTETFDKQYADVV